jgi:hypothetical protein
VDKKSMTVFQAKSIQEILGITKSRYDFILAKIHIDADIQKGRGTGKVNIFSFKKLLEFAIATKGIDIGMSLEDLTCSLKQIISIDRNEGWGIFSYKNNGFYLSFSHGLCTEGKFYCFSGDVGGFLSSPRFCAHHPKANLYRGKKIIPIACSTLCVSEIKKNLISIF